MDKCCIVMCRRNHAQLIRCLPVRGARSPWIGRRERGTRFIRCTPIGRALRTLVRRPKGSAVAADGDPRSFDGTPDRKFRRHSARGRGGALSAIRGVDSSSIELFVIGGDRREMENIRVKYSSTPSGCIGAIIVLSGIFLLGVNRQIGLGLQGVLGD
ncbi:hypothetical protein EVAR_77097_1 [Eumeta japonica]|uniref:Uncharacterized protein n=1 Tax=Eumeta variegata TaxID=151549 RepID=A0A4C1T4L0_EUMVA|nr:hypothetical protein EVAR_77097_1 [Eumeta japonica]